MELNSKRKFINLMRKYNLAKFQPEAPFTLASGAVSPYYFDVKSAMMLSTTKRCIKDLLEGAIEDGYYTLTGGIANAAYLLLGIADNLTRGFVMRKAEKGHGIIGKVDGFPPRAGDVVTLVEDVITTGGSILPVIGYVESQGATVEKIIAVVDRNENDKLGKYRALVYPLTTKEDYFPFCG